MAPEPETFSELEQQQEELLAMNGAANKRPGLQARGWVLAAAGALLLLSVAALWLSMGRASPAHPAATEAAGIVQTYALQQIGRKLTREELAQVRHYVAASPAALVTTPRAGLQVRWLLGLFEEEEHDGEDEGHDGEQEGSKGEFHDFLKALKSAGEDCVEDMMEFGRKAVKKVIERGIAVFVACSENDESKDCLIAQKKLERLEDEMQQECKDTGDICKVVEVSSEGNETEDTCLPKSCHNSAEYMSQAVTKMVQEHEPDCTDCSVIVTC